MSETIQSKMERIVVASALDWTIARPPRLTNGPRTGRYDVEDGHLPGRSAFATISRADVAEFLISEIQRISTSRRGRTSACALHGRRSASVRFILLRGLCAFN